MGGCLFRVFALTCLDRLIACFDTLDRALAPGARGRDRAVPAAP
jgi:hypothetical protein